MKNNFFLFKINSLEYLFFLICVLESFSCSKGFLNTNPEAFVTDNNFYKDTADFNQAVYGIYGQLQTYYLEDAHILKEGRSDNTTYDNFLDQGSLGEGPQLALIDQFKMSSNSTVVSSAWDHIYSAIKDCNFTIERLRKNDNVDDNFKTRLEAEVRFLRSFLYFDAVRIWGDIPLIIEPITDIPKTFEISRTSQQEVFDQIIQDGEFAISNLPVKYPDAQTGRATKGASMFLMSRVYMTLGNFSEAESLIRQIVGLSLYSILPNYSDVFSPQNKNNNESIFELQFKDGDRGEASSFIYRFAPVGAPNSLLPGPGIGSGRNLPSLDMIASYEANDIRKKVSIDSFERAGGGVYYINKYANASDPNFNHSPDNFIIYRYADALLMLAELLNEQQFIPDGEAFSLFNQIRTRAGLSPLSSIELSSQDDFRNALTQERRVEFAFENHRWFYLIRKGIAISVMEEYGKREIAHPTTPPPSFLPYDEKSFKLNINKLFYPIPDRELNLNSNMTQNIGY